MAEHNILTDPFLHEPKGVSTAAAGLAYLANGAGSGVWAIPPLTLMATLADVSTPSTTYVPVPKGGKVTRVVGVLHAAITIANSVITVKNAAGVSMGTVVVPFSGSAAGQTFVITPVANNVIGNNSFLTVETDGGSTTTAIITFAIIVENP
jgi:hypothetical protein